MDPMGYGILLMIQQILHRTDVFQNQAKIVTRKRKAQLVQPATSLTINIKGSVENGCLSKMKFP